MTVAYEHEYYRNTKDGNRQHCRKLFRRKSGEDERQLIMSLPGLPAADNQPSSKRR